MSIVKPYLESVTETLGKDLVIPTYQRPYKWDESLVSQLLTDLLAHPEIRDFRLGTLVFHQDNSDSKRHVVDGQQRLMTMALLMHALDDTWIPRLQHERREIPLESRKNLASNYGLICSRIDALNPSRKAALKTFLETRCNWCVIELSELSEAFQFFDSHNTRGKPLEPYDLLKAYHLRAMREEKDKKVEESCVAEWEHAASSGDLKEVMDKFLYRIRRWLQGKSGIEFKRTDIGLFKGVRLEEAYPYLLGLRMQELCTLQYACDPMRYLDRQMLGFPFQIGQVIIDGRRFFEYVQHYVAQRKSLETELERIDPELCAMLGRYPGRRRKGDTLTRNLFECALLCILDKFGPDALKDTLPVAFAWAYELRLKRVRVDDVSMDNKAREPESLIKSIQHAVRPGEIASRSKPRLKRGEVKDSAKSMEIQKYLVVEERA